MGDFNCVCSEYDRSRPAARYDRSAATLADLVHEHGLIDVGQMKGSAVHFTHFQCSSNARLDRIYIYQQRTFLAFRTIMYVQYFLLTTVWSQSTSVGQDHVTSPLNGICGNLIPLYWLTKFFAKGYLIAYSIF